jgi:hypothetical protein
LFNEFWPRVKPEGVYVVEDLHTSYWPQFGGGSENSMVKFLSGLTETLDAEANKLDSRSPNVGSPLTFLEQTIQAIHFYQSICFLFKKG